MSLGANDPAAIQQRIDVGRIGWAGLLALTTARTVLLLVVQAAVAVGFFVRGHPSPWRAHASWWSVYATLVDVGCLLLLRRLSRREGIRLADLFGVDRSHLGREVLWGLAVSAASLSGGARRDRPRELGRLRRASARLRQNGAGPPDGAPAPILGRRLQPLAILDPLVTYRRGHLSGLPRSAAPGPDRAHLGDADARGILVGAPA